MNKKIRWITETAVMLALLVSLQAITKPLGQLVTGSCVNTVLAISALVGGLSCGLVVALCSPVLAFLLGIAPAALTVPAIMAGNAVFVVLLSQLADKTGKQIVKQVFAWVLAAVGRKPPGLRRYEAPHADQSPRHFLLAPADHRPHRWRHCPGHYPGVAQSPA